MRTHVLDEGGTSTPVSPLSNKGSEKKLPPDSHILQHDVLR